MGLSQALSAALAGVNTTQKSLSVIAGNVANANTPGYVAETVNQTELASGGLGGVSVDFAGINRNLNTLLQSQLWTETSGASYADLAAQYYQELQPIYGTPGSSSAFDAVYSTFTNAVQALAANPSAATAQSAVIGAAQALTQNLNAMSGTIQQLRTQAEQSIAGAVTTANNLLQQIAQINGKLEGTTRLDSAAAALEDQRGQAVTQLAQLMNVTIVQNPDNQLSVFTGTGQQLVGGPQASQLSFNNAGTLSATSAWNADPNQDSAGTITLTTPGGPSTDLIASGAIRSGQLAALLQMRDSTLPQAQTQLDEFANQMAQALSNVTTSGTAVTAGTQSGFKVAIGSVLPGNSVQVTYTDATNTAHTVSIVSLAAGGSLPLQNSAANPANQTIGIDFSGGINSVVSQLNAAFGSALQFANAGGMLQVLNAGASTTVNALSATATATTLVNGNAQVPLFTDGSNPITGAISATGSQTVGLAGRITVNPALLASPAGLVAFAAGTAAGDPTRPNFILQQLTAATPTYSALTGIGSAQAPYSGTLPNYLSQVISQQSQAASAASNLQQGQDTVLNALQQRFNDQSGVNIDTEMSNLIALQSAYSANARVMTTVQQLLATLMQVVQ
jgi:flagellar hook-associated protein 1 FlgK